MNGDKYDNVNNYVPSILNPRVLKKQNGLSFTQYSTASRCSLSLKRPNKLTGVNTLNKIKLLNKENTQDICNQKVNTDVTTTQSKAHEDSSGFFSVKDLVKLKDYCSELPVVRQADTLKLSSLPNEKQETKEICTNAQKNLIQETQITKNLSKAVADDISLGFSYEGSFGSEDKNLYRTSTNRKKQNPIDAIVTKDLPIAITDDISSEISFLDESFEHEKQYATCDKDIFYKPRKETASVESVREKVNDYNKATNFGELGHDTSKCHSAAVRLENIETISESTMSYDFLNKNATINVSFGVNDCKTVNVQSKSGAIKKISITRNEKSTDIECEIIENSQISTETEVEENMNVISSSPLKRLAVAVTLEIKKQKLTHDDSAENSKVLILKANAIEKISHVIVQPLNYKSVKRSLTPISKYKDDKSRVRNGNSSGGKLTQLAIESFFGATTDDKIDYCKLVGTVSKDEYGWKEMSRNWGVIDAAKCDRVKSARQRRDLEVPKSPKVGLNDAPTSAGPSKRDLTSSRRQDTKGSIPGSPTPRSRNDIINAHAPRKNVESLHFTLPVKSKSNRTSVSPMNIPHHKIVAGTHFAVDAFSYGEIPNVKHYFLTHFHSDHYSGLKKSFSKLLFCSKITADLCISRLGVNPKTIRVINVDEVIRIEGVEVAAVDANHCPGALMLIFTLPNGKTLLHTGDFRACPAMESYPVFWNKDVHTVYLDTTYCNPRYDFPTQEQSLEMAFYILRQKKMALEKVGKKFSTVLIVCGTYTIGKEKFFLGMSRRVGCGVWACPEKERVLQIVEGRACSRDPPDSCQLHVVPMRDLTHEKLRSYLDSLQGAFSEVVAFKPSGWENGKNSAVEKDLVTIHGIPYSEHSSFSELIRFINFLKPKQVVPTVDISGGVKSVQKYFPCPIVYKEEFNYQAKLTDYFSIHNRQQVPAVT